MLAPCVIVVSVEVQGIIIGNAVGVFILRVCRRSLFHKVTSVGIIELLFKLGLFITQMVVCIFTHQFDVLQRSNRHLSEDTDIVFLDSRRIRLIRFRGVLIGSSSPSIFIVPVGK